MSLINKIKQLTMSEEQKKKQARERDRRMNYLKRKYSNRPPPY
jgi:hypothetical protein